MDGAEWEKDIIWDRNWAMLNGHQVHKFLDAMTRWVVPGPGQIVTEESNLSESWLSSLDENQELIEGNWEKDIIWDVDDFINTEYAEPEPSQPKLPVSESKGMNFPEVAAKGKGKENKIEQQGLTKSKKSRGVKPDKKSEENNNGIINYNISNDEYYQPTRNDADRNASGLKYSTLGYLRHSKLVLEMRAPFMKTFLNPEELRDFHRPKIHKFPVTFYDALGHGRCKIASLTAHIKRKVSERMKIAAAKGYEDQLTLDQPIDLSGRDGEIVLIENSEEHPPLLSQVGMCSKIVNYYRRNSTASNNKSFIPGMRHAYGESAQVQASSPFLGVLEPGQVITTLENNLYRCPIYKHANCKTDFLLITNQKTQCLIREFNATFTAGQQCPLMEVLDPNSIKIRLFLRNFIKAFTFRQLLECPPFPPPKIRFTDVTKYFPNVNEASIRSWLRQSVDIDRLGPRTWVKVKHGFQLPSKEELEAMVSPEQCCAYYSLLAGKQRLEDAGVHSILSLTEIDGECDTDAKRAAEKGESDGMQKEYSLVEQEVLAAPWNTTSAYVAAAKGKCLLQVTGFADPTGCGEGISYVRAHKRPHPSKQASAKQANQQSGKLGGTDADLRRVSSKKAKEMLLKAGVSVDDIKGKTHWQIIDMLRTLSTEKMKQGGLSDSVISKFSRYNNKGQMNQGRFQEECQRVFELQNKLLSSREVLSSTDEEDDEDDVEHVNPDCDWEDIDRMGRNVEKILNGDMTTFDLTHQEEELGRMELQKQFFGQIKEKGPGIAKKNEESKKSNKNVDILRDLIKNPGRVLKITRKFAIKGESAMRTQVEIVKDPMVAAAYVGIRTTKDDAFIKNFLREEDIKLRKERKLQQRLLRDKLNREMEKQAIEAAICAKTNRKRKIEAEEDYYPTKAAKMAAEKRLHRTSRATDANAKK